MEGLSELILYFSLPIFLILLLILLGSYETLKWLINQRRNKNGKLLGLINQKDVISQSFILLWVIILLLTIFVVLFRIINEVPPFKGL